MKINKKNETSLFVREVLALSYLAVGVFFSLCLLSYHPFDPSFSGISHGQPVQNWGGIIGSYVADILIVGLGGGAYFISFFFFLISILLFSGARTKVRLHEVVLYFVFVVLVSVLFKLFVSTLMIDETPIKAGGLVGEIIGETSVAFLGRPGTYLLVVLATLLTFVWATQLSMREIFSFAKKMLSPAFRYMAQNIVVGWARSRKAFTNWRQKRKQQKISPVVAQPKVNQIVSRPLKKEEPVKVPAKISEFPVASAVLSEPKIYERVSTTKQTEKVEKKVSTQMTLKNMGEGYQLPPLSLLDSDIKSDPVVVDEGNLKMQAILLENKLKDFSIDGNVTEIHPGPVITMFEFAPAPGVKLSRISNLVDDLSMAMGGRLVRIIAPLPNKSAIGIEIPNHTRETVLLKDIIADDSFSKSESKLCLALGKDTEGKPYSSDLAKMPHLLVAGATGAGKSVSINSMILSVLYKARPDEVRLIMVDPKMLELSIYEGIPHLLLPVVTDPKKASMALRWAVREMERRYKLLSDINARNIGNYNKKIEKGDYESRSAKMTDSLESEKIKHDGTLPYIVILIDELADLMMVSSREVEESITRLAQMARAAGIHLILATQRPSVDVLTGVIKANFPARISFKVTSRHDARTILDTIGSEQLLGSGDMLFIPPGISQMKRVHGAFITETEIGRVVDFLKTQQKPIYDESILKPLENEEGSGIDGEEGSGEPNDNLYDQAVQIVAETKQASISMVQRRLRVGYNRAARMIEQMEKEGIVSPPSGAGHRQVLVSSFDAAQS